MYVLLCIVAGARWSGGSLGGAYIISVGTAIVFLVGTAIDFVCLCFFRVLCLFGVFIAAFVLPSFFSFSCLDFLVCVFSFL